jgi:hypothetical protein
VTDPLTDITGNLGVGQSVGLGGVAAGSREDQTEDVAL